jgi:hypothetical protein
VFKLAAVALPIDANQGGPEFSLEAIRSKTEAKKREAK